MKKLKSNAAGTTIKAMPAEMLKKMVDKTINDCVDEGLIVSFGNDKGEFIFKHKDESINRSYAVINGMAIPVSAAINEDPDSVTDILGDLTFTTGFSQEKYLKGEVSDAPEAEYVPWYRLGMPRGLNLGDAVVAVEYAVEAG